MSRPSNHPQYRSMPPSVATRMAAGKRPADPTYVQRLPSPRSTLVYGSVAVIPLRSFGFNWLPLMTSR